MGIVALPLALAFGVASGVGAAAGLVTAVVAGILAAVFGGSHVQVSGPTGAMVVILAPLVAIHGVAAVPLLSVMAGLFVLLLGVLGMGRAVSLIPWPVVEGFTLGIAIIIFLQQVPNALGTTVEPGQNTAVAAVAAFASATWPDALLSVFVVIITAAVIVVLPRLHKSLPGPLLAIVLATVAVKLLNWEVPSIGTLPSGLPKPVLPDLSLALELWRPALAIAALAAIESLLSARVAASMASTGSYHPDRELVGQGIASIGAGVFGGMPATGAIARTAVNVRSGGRSRLSAVVHAVALLAVIYLGSGLVSHIPLAALAGILMVTAVGMSSARTIRRLTTATRSDALVFTVTAFVTVAFDLIQAIEIGLLCAAFFALRTLAKMSGVVRQPTPDTPQPGDEHIAIFRIDGAMFFGASERLLTEINSVTGVQVVILRLSNVQILDSTGARALVEIIEGLERRGITVLVKGLRSHHSTLARRVGVVDSLRVAEHLFADLDDAVAHARSHVARALAAQQEAERALEEAERAAETP